MKTFNKIFYSVLASFLLTLFALTSQAQQQLSFELSWKKGKVVLASGDTVYGGVVLSSPKDMIQVLNADGSSRYYSPVDVINFEVNESENKNRMTNKGASAKMEFNFQYQVYPWNRDRDYSTFIAPAFFIVVQPGEYALLMRLEKVAAGGDSPSRMIGSSVGGMLGAYGMGKMAEQILEEKLYLKMPGDKVIALRKPESDLKRLFPNQYDKIRKYAQQNVLEYKKPLDLAKIIAFANSISI